MGDKLQTSKMSLSQKLVETAKLIKFHGGLRGSYWTVYYTDQLKHGKHMGTDEFGNRYYENRKYFFGRNRWVEYTHAVGTDYDASMVPPLWRNWLMHATDETPVMAPPKERKWVDRFQYNKTGSAKEYVPYSTAKPKAEAWKPQSTA